MFEEDITAFFSTDDFAVSAVIGGYTVNGIFDSQYVEIETGGAPIAGYRPVFECASVDISGVEYGDAAVVAGGSYKVVGIQPDGTGITKIILSE